MKFREVITSVAGITALIVVVAAPQAVAQGQIKRPTQSKVTDRRVTIPPVTVLNNPEYLSGEASISVAANSNPLLRIGMTQNGVTLIEFPASDKFFAVHAGNSDLVTIEKSPSLKRDHHLVLRAGSGFLVPTSRTKSTEATAPATSIVAQMNSGMAITIMVYPVSLLKQQAHRVVINYKTEDVVRARHAAGLATNLTQPEASTENAKAEPAIDQRTEPKVPVVPDEGASSPRPKPDYGPPAEAALNEAMKNPKWFRQWTKERHGLSISVLPARELSDTARLVVFAVRNETFEHLRVISGYPALYVETLNEKRRPVEAGTRVPKLHLASNASDSTIRGGAIRYFALVYEVPILGVSQHLKLVVAHMSAADEPATVDLTKPAK